MTSRFAELLTLSPLGQQIMIKTGSNSKISKKYKSGDNIFIYFFVLIMPRCHCTLNKTRTHTHTHEVKELLACHPCIFSVSWN